MPPPPRARRQTREQVLALLDPDPVVPRVSGRVSAGQSAAAAAAAALELPPVEPPLETFGPITKYIQNTYKLNKQIKIKNNIVILSILTVQTCAVFFDSSSCTINMTGTMF
jgi:hypothetical protein